MKQTFADDVLNSLNLQVAILDDNGTVIAVNEGWRRFARENGGDEGSFYVGANYVAICEAAIRQNNDATSKMVLDGIRAVLGGEKNSCAIEYPCHSPSQKRWFNVQLTRFFHEQDVYLVMAHEDITDRKLAEDRVHETEATLRGVLEALPIGVWIMDRFGQIIQANAAVRRIWSGGQHVGPDNFGEFKGWWLDSGQPVVSEDWASVRAVKRGQASFEEEIRIQCFDGSSKIILNSAMPLRDRDGEITGAVVVNQDITARKQAEEELRMASAAVDVMNRELQLVLAREQRKARTDDLTELHNRRYFFELAEQLLAVARRYQTSLSLMMFDIDHFKRVNDLFGHQIGDRILQHVARVARAHMRHADILARYGGEEFIAILPNVGVHSAFIAAEHIREEVAAWRGYANDRELKVTVSVGVAELTSGDDTLDHLIERADRALYFAKNSGRNCSKISSPVHAL